MRLFPTLRRGIAFPRRWITQEHKRLNTRVNNPGHLLAYRILVSNSFLLLLVRHLLLEAMHLLVVATRLEYTGFESTN